MSTKIEEMARDLGNPTYGCKFDTDCCKECCLDGDCMPQHYAYVAYNAGYRKIPEGAVVRIDRNLFNEIVNDILLSVKPVYLRKDIASKMLDLTNRLIAGTREETAEKFAEKAIDAFFGVNCIDIDEWGWYQNRLGEICKEIKEGK